ncbi:MAG: NAD-binding protein, partial [Acidimicrobiia bacterium]|nr:NAD-binding protein [Acidimicrobiia bacterium]
VVARPLGVLLSTIGSDLSRNARILLAGVAPRGIVAASVASVFALELEEAGVEGVEGLTAYTFAVIVATVVLYGLGTGPLARKLGLATSVQEGVLIVGAGPVEQAIGQALVDSGFDVIVATTNRRDDYLARMTGLRTFYGNVLDHEIDLTIDLSGMGRLLSLTPNDEVNTLATQRFSEIFGGSNTFQLAAGAAPPGIEGSAVDLGGRVLFGEDMDYERLEQMLNGDGHIRRTSLTDDVRPQELDECDVPLFLVRNGKLMVATADPVRPFLAQAQPGDTLVWLDCSRAPAAVAGNETPIPEGEATT